MLLLLRHVFVGHLVIFLSCLMLTWGACRDVRMPFRWDIRSLSLNLGFPNTYVFSSPLILENCANPFAVLSFSKCPCFRSVEPLHWWPVCEIRGGTRCLRISLQTLCPPLRPHPFSSHVHSDLGLRSSLLPKLLRTTKNSHTATLRTCAPARSSQSWRLKWLPSCFRWSFGIKGQPFRAKRTSWSMLIAKLRRRPTMESFATRWPSLQWGTSMECARGPFSCERPSLRTVGMHTRQRRKLSWWLGNACRALRGPVEPHFDLLADRFRVKCLAKPWARASGREWQAERNRALHEHAWRRTGAFAERHNCWRRAHASSKPW